MIDPIKNRLFSWSNASLAALSLLTLAPLLVTRHFDPVHSFHQEWVAIVLGLSACLFALPLIWQQQTLFIPRLTLLPMALMAFITVQAQILPLVVIQHAQMGMLYLLWAALLMVLVKLLVAQTSREYVSLWIAIGVSAAALCSTSIELFYRLNGVLGIWGSVFQPNNYGDLLTLGLASVLYLLTIKPAWRVPLLVVAVLIVLGLSLTPSRSVWLYWIALLTIAALLERGMIKWLIMAVALYVLLQVLWIVDLLPAVKSNVTATERLYEGVNGASIRLHFWQIAWQLFTQTPWLGQGFGQIDWGYFQAGQFIPEFQGRLEHAHNLILHLLAELGLLPVLLLLGLLGLWLKNVLAVITEKRHADEPNSLNFYVWLLMLLAILGIHSLLEYPLWYAQFLGVAAIALALGDTQEWRLPLAGVARLAASTIIVVSIAIASVHEWHYATIEKTLAEYTQFGSQSKLNQLISESQLAAAQAPLLAPYITVIFSLASDLSNEQRRADVTILNNAGYHFWPSGFLAYQRAELQALNGANSEAQHIMTLALGAYPYIANQFIDELTLLNVADQQKTTFLRDMALSKTQ